MDQHFSAPAAVLGAIVAFSYSFFVGALLVHVI